VALSLVAFQNCSPVAFQSFDFLRSGNNGASYGGKPSKDYFRFIPEHTCEERSAPKAMLSISMTAVELTENKFPQCGVKTPNIDPNLVDGSPFQSHVIGYKEGIYEFQDTDPTAIPSELVEAWCRDGSGDGAVETITHFDRVQRRAITELYYQRNSVRTQAPNFAVGRVVGPAQVEFANSEGFQLTIHRDRPTPVVGLFEGELRVEIAGTFEQRKVACRLGADLDVTVWPAKTIADLNVGRVQLNAGKTHFAYLTSLMSPTSYGAAGIQLFLGQLSHSGHRLLTPAGRSTSRFDWSPNGQRLVFDGDRSVLYSADLVGSAVTQLNSGLPANELLDGTLQISSDGARVYFLQGANDPTKRRNLLYSTLIDGGGIRTLADFSLARDGFNRFFLTPNSERIIFTSNGVTRHVYVADTTTGEIRDLSSKVMQLTSDDVCVGWCSPELLEVSPVGDYFMVMMSDPMERPSLKHLAVAMDGSWTRELPRAVAVNFYNKLLVSHSGSFIVGSPGGSDQNWEIYDLVSPLRLPIDGTALHSFFSSDSSHFYDLSSAPLGVGSDATAFDLNAGQIKKMCAEAQGSALDVAPISQSDSVAIAIRESDQIIKIWISDQNGLNCRPVAEVPLHVGPDQALTLDISHNAQNAMLRLHEPAAFETFSRSIRSYAVYYVPLDGRPAFQVTMPTSSSARIWDAEFLNDSSSILLRGTLVDPELAQVFLWQPPPSQ
ncbi:MAG: hypothetical protein NDI61_12775, partial [Bdellovibrionaceae bacterium]|nr:hypothetical protein [Pseudobdellovibrionaceae bacterium]